MGKVRTVVFFSFFWTFIIGLSSCAEVKEESPAGDALTDVMADVTADSPSEGATCLAGRVSCEGSVAATCRDDGLGYESFENCDDTGRTCTEGVGCTVCMANEGACEGNTPKRCKSDGSGWDLLPPCDSAGGYVCSSGICASLCDKARSTNSYIGCDYWAVPTANSMLAEEFEFAVVIANPQDMEAGIEITDGGGFTQSLKVSPGSLETVTLPYKREIKLYYYEYESVAVRNGAYKIKSSVPVTIYQFNPLEYMVNYDCSSSEHDIPGDYQCHSYTNDASLLLPEHVLTGDYLAMTRPTGTVGSEYSGAVDSIPGFLTIVGTSPEPTNVTLTFSTKTIASSDGTIGEYCKGETETFVIQQHEVLQILSGFPDVCNNPDYSEAEATGVVYCDNDKDFDFTGTRIGADRPVAVFAGHDCTFAPFNRWACDHLEEQLFPLETWGKEYVVYRTRPMFDYNPEPNIWKIISGRDGNVLTFDPPSVHAEAALNEGEWIEFKSLENFKVTGTEGFMMAQFMVGMNYYGIYEASPDGDPAMCLAVPYEQYRNEYTFLAPLTYERSFVNVTTVSGNESSLMMDGEAVSGSWSPIGSSGFVGTAMEITGGSHTLTGEDVFGIIVYGVSDYTSYMYPGGMDLEKIFVI